MQKTAFDFTKLLPSRAAIGDFTAGTLALIYGLGLTGGGLIGHLAAKATSPEAFIKNSDKEIEKEALQTEIDVTERRLAALELRKKRKKQQAQIEEQKFDRFV